METVSKSPVTIEITPPPKPTKDEIYDWLMDTYGLLVKKASAWAYYLEGLPWGYIKPVVQIAINAGHEHPAIVLSASAGMSTDLVFKLVARNHIDAKGGSA
jgi:hypothetical protein